MWGKPGAELEDAEIDSGDPNYDSEAMDDDIQLEQVTVELTEDEVKVGAAGAGSVARVSPVCTLSLVMEYQGRPVRVSSWAMFSAPSRSRPLCRLRKLLEM